MLLEIREINESHMGKNITEIVNDVDTELCQSPAKNDDYYPKRIVGFAFRLPYLDIQAHPEISIALVANIERAGQGWSPLERARVSNFL